MDEGTLIRLDQHWQSWKKDLLDTLNHLKLRWRFKLIILSEKQYFSLHQSIFICLKGPIKVKTWKFAGRHKNWCSQNLSSQSPACAVLHKSLFSLYWYKAGKASQFYVCSAFSAGRNKLEGKQSNKQAKEHWETHVAAGNAVKCGSANNWPGLILFPHQNCSIHSAVLL